MRSETSALGVKKIDFSNLNLGELKVLNKNLKLYSLLRKNLGLRGIKKFKKDLAGESSFEVEYFSSIDVDTVYNEAVKIYKKVFNLSPEKEEINFVKNDNILGGIKVYKDDEMIDLSFSKIEKLLNN